MNIKITRSGKDLEIEYSKDLLKYDEYTYAAFLEDAIRLLQAELITQEASFE
jgi:protein-arginine kinase activator protein McsA